MPNKGEEVWMLEVWDAEEKIFYVRTVFASFEKCQDVAMTTLDGFEGYLEESLEGRYDWKTHTYSFVDLQNICWVRYRPRWLD